MTRLFRIGLLLFAFVPAATAAVRYADGRITAHLEGADMVDVLREVAGQARLETRGAPIAPQPVSVQLDAVPLAEALPRLLAGQSFLLTYAGERVKGVKFLGSSDSLGFVVPTAPEVVSGEPEAESGSLAASHRMVPLLAWLERVAGEYAQEIARRTAKRSRNGPLRQRAAAVERLLETNISAPRG